MPTRTPTVKLFAALACVLLAVPPLAAQGAPAEPVDRVLALVDGDPILASDIERVIALGLVERQAGEGPEAFRRRVLEREIEHRLRFSEIDRFGFGQVPPEEVEEQLAAIAQRHGGAAALAAELESAGLDQDALRQIIARQLMVLTYVEERLGPRVFVSLEDIREHYATVLVPDLQRRGLPVPAIEKVREQIRALLKEERLNEEIERWTEQLRAEADVEMFFDREDRPLPPVVGVKR